jgi:hypothetical protein
MKLPKPRFTLRWLMAAVAVVGLLFGFARWVEARRFRFEAICQDQERLWKEVMTENRCRDYDGPRPTREDDAALVAKIEHILEMRRIYKHAARYPWLPVEPEPPVRK